MIITAADGTPLAFDITPSTGASSEAGGVPVLLLHGSVLTRAIWRGLGYVDALREQRPVIRMDLRGHGTSGKPHHASAYAQAVLVRDVMAVLDAAGADRAHLVGYSLGARSALAAAITHPDRIASLTCLGGSADDQRGAIDQVFFPGTIATLRSGGMEAFCDAQGLTPEAVAEHPRRRASRHVFMTADPLAIAALFEATESTPAIPDDDLRACSVPALWMTGTEDRPRFEQSQRAADVMPDARFVPLEGRSHAATLWPSGPVLEHLVPHLAAHD